MAELFNEKDGAIGKEFFQNFSSLWYKRNNDIGLFLDDPYKIQDFISVAALFCDIANYLTAEQWQKVAPYMLANIDKVGTFNFYINVFKLIFGQNSGIVFNLATPQPGVLGITITYNASGNDTRSISDDDTRVINTGDERIITWIEHEITFDNIRGILSKIVPSGIWTQINIQIA